MEMRYRQLSLLIANILLFTSPAWAVPNNTMSVTPACTSGASILCSDETTRNNNISTPYNAHTHTDIAAMTGVNTFTIGDNTAGNKDYCEDGATDRCLRYNSTADLWTIQQGGTTYNQVVTFTGTVGVGAGQVLVANGTAAIVGITSGASGTLLRSSGVAVNPVWSTPTFPNTGGTAGQWLRTDGTNYGLSTPTLPNAATVNNALLGDGTNYVNTAVPNCTDASGNHLNYTTATNVFSCGTTSSTAAYTYVSRDGTFTRDISLTTNLTVTTTGVNPTRCDFTLSGNTVGTFFSYGRSTSVPSAGQSVFGTSTAGNYDEAAGVWRYQVDGTNFTLATMSSYGTAQFTLAFTKTGTPTGTAFLSWRCEN